MPFKKKVKRRSYSRPKRRSSSRFAKWQRRASKAKPSLETLIAAGAIPFTPAQDGWGTIFDDAKSGNFNAVALQLKSGFLGMKEGTTFDLIGLINPFDFNVGRFSKMLVFAEVAGRVRRKFAPRSSDLIRKIPFIGRWVR